MTNPLLTLDNIRSGAVPSDAVAVGFLLGENDELREVIARCYMRMQCADVPREPWHWEVCTTLDNTGIPSALEPGACAVVNEQAEDEGLWFQPVYASEAYLQAALRRLHAAVEGASRDASSDESCTYCGRTWGDEKTTRCPLQGEELRCHARKP